MGRLNKEFAEIIGAQTELRDYTVKCDDDRVTQLVQIARGGLVPAALQTIATARLELLDSGLYHESQVDDLARVRGRRKELMAADRKLRQVVVLGAGALKNADEEQARAVRQAIQTDKMVGVVTAFGDTGVKWPEAMNPANSLDLFYLKGDRAPYIFVNDGTVPVERGSYAAEVLAGFANIVIKEARYDPGASELVWATL